MEKGNCRPCEVSNVLSVALYLIESQKQTNKKPVSLTLPQSQKKCSGERSVTFNTFNKLDQKATDILNRKQMLSCRCPQPLVHGPYGTRLRKRRARATKLHLRMRGIRLHAQNHPLSPPPPIAATATAASLWSQKGWGLLLFWRTFLV